MHQVYGPPARRRSSWPFALGIAAAVAALVLGSVLIGSALLVDDSPAPATSTAGPAAPAADTDPYETFLKLAPADAPKMSREDAQARAFLGCGQNWAPGTTDAALAKAYGHLCAQWASSAPRP